MQVQAVSEGSFGQVGDAVEEALHDGAPRVEVGEPRDEAIVRLDEGIRIISQAVAMASTERARDEDALAAEYESRSRNARMYLGSIEATETLDEENRAFAASLRRELEQSDREYSSGDLEAASDRLDASYHKIIDLVGRATQGGNLFVERTFATPEDEFEYELARNKNYELLVGIMLQEQAGTRPGLVELANGLTAESGELRERAVMEADLGEAVKAIQTIERSTELFIVVLRSAGLVLTE